MKKIPSLSAYPRLVYVILGLLAVLLYIEVTRVMRPPSTPNSDWFAQNIPTWNTYIPEFKNKPNIHCLEIGSYEGRSSIYIAENFCKGTGSQLTCVDTWEGSIENDRETVMGLFQRFLHNTNHLTKKKKLIALKGKSETVLVDLLHKVRGGQKKYDFIYIDGSHSAKDVLLDAVLAWELLKVGGILIFDDYLWFDHSYASPKPAIDGFLASYKTMYEILHMGYQVHLRKIRETPDLTGKVYS